MPIRWGSIVTKRASRTKQYDLPFMTNLNWYLYAKQVYLTRKHVFLSVLAADALPPQTSPNYNQADIQQPLMELL